MEVYFFPIFLFMLGACFGSFLCCQARRLHLTKAKRKSFGSRSVCTHCHYQLKWYDNLPIISWLALRGKCRKCHKKIGIAEILSEIGLGSAFSLVGTSIVLSSGIQLYTSDSVIAYNSIPAALFWAVFILTLFFVTILGFLAIYDGLYGELPTLGLTTSIIFGIILLILNEYQIFSSTSFTPELIYQPLLSILILGGLYLVLYLISKGKWVGDGDWILATAIALVLFDPWLALVALFLANFIACLVMLPFIKSKKNHHIHFGPFLVIAFVIAYSFSDFFLSLIG